MTVAQTARRIGISASKLYQLVAARRIPHYRVDGKILFTEDDVAGFLESCRVGAATPPSPVKRARVKLRHIKLS